MRSIQLIYKKRQWDESEVPFIYVDNFLDGVNLAAETIDNGDASKKLDQLIEVTNS